MFYVPNQMLFSVFGLKGANGRCCRSAKNVHFWKDKQTVSFWVYSAVTFSLKKRFSPVMGRTNVWVLPDPVSAMGVQLPPVNVALPSAS